MRAVSMVLGAALMISFVTGCGPGLKAPKVEDGKIQVFALVDRGVEGEADVDKVKQRDQVGTWMEGDLANLFRKNGYDFQQIASEEDFVPAAHRFLLKVKVLSYHPGNKGARVAGALVGGWSGAAMAQAAEARLAANFQLIGPDGALVSGDTNQGSGTGDWNVAVRNVNVVVIKSVAKKIQSLYK